MALSDEWKIGDEFIDENSLLGRDRYRVTDVGSRVIVAINLDLDLERADDPSWFNGPPYGVVECVFDEDAIGGLERCK
jgi:hypothetical protein